MAQFRTDRSKIFISLFLKDVSRVLLRWNFKISLRTNFRRLQIPIVFLFCFGMTAHEESLKSKFYLQSTLEMSFKNKLVKFSD